jgi:hypothetical protein
MERDMRSLERRSMQSIFAPLDPEERLPRELLDSSRFHLYRGDTSWKQLASFLWPPALILTLGLVTARFNDALPALIAAIFLFIAFGWFILRRHN